MKTLIHLFTIIALTFLITSCGNRKFENDVEFQQWLNNKHFVSTTEDFQQTDLNGTLHLPVGTLDLVFKNNTLIYQNCPPQSYDVHQDGNQWIVSFDKCGNGDTFELVVPETGESFVRSIDYDTSKLEEESRSAVGRLDAELSKKKVDGPNMKIME